MKQKLKSINDTKDNIQNNNKKLLETKLNMIKYIINLETKITMMPR